MADREKLIELLVNSPGLDTLYGTDDEFAENADFLIENGVTIQKWIPVTERLPKHGDVVLVWHNYMEHPFVCQWDERADVWLDDTWTFGRNTITHWMPLPEPPKGE